MNWLPRILATSHRTESAVGRTRSQKPRLESLEERALLSANPATLHSGGVPAGAVSSQSSAIISGADASHGTMSDHGSSIAVHGGYAREGMILIPIRHVVAT
jgi:hypothetical protein